MMAGFINVENEYLLNIFIFILCVMKIIKTFLLSMTVLATCIFWVCCVFFHHTNSSFANNSESDNNSASVCYNYNLELLDDEQINNFVAEETVSKTNNAIYVLTFLIPSRPFSHHWRPPRII